MIYDGTTLKSNTPSRDAHFSRKWSKLHFSTCILQGMLSKWLHFPVINPILETHPTHIYPEEHTFPRETLTIIQRNKNKFLNNSGKNGKKTSKRVKYTSWHIFQKEKKNGGGNLFQQGPSYECLLISYSNLQASEYQSKIAMQ